MHVTKYCALATIAFSLIVDQSHAAIFVFTDRNTFETQEVGSVVEPNLHVNGYSSTQITPVSDPFVLGAVQFNATPDAFNSPNIVVGSNVTGTTSPSQNSHNVVSYDGRNILTGTIGGNYNMFGFDIGGLYGNDPIELSFTTSLGGTYDIDNDAVISDLNGGALTFYGFHLDGLNEFFTGFTLTSSVIHMDPADDTAPAITNIALGAFPVTAAPVAGVPEPSSVLLLGMGALGLAWAAARRRRKLVA